MLRRRIAGLVVGIGVLGAISSGLAATKVFQPGIDPTTGKPLATSQGQKPGFPVIHRGTADEEPSVEREPRLATRPPTRGSLQVLPKSQSQHQTASNPAAAVFGGIQKLGQTVFGRIRPGSDPILDEPVPGTSMRQANPHYRRPLSTEPRAGSILSRTADDTPTAAEISANTARPEPIEPAKPDRTSTAPAKRDAAAQSAVSSPGKRTAAAASAASSDSPTVGVKAAPAAPKRSTTTTAQASADAAAADVTPQKPAAAASSPAPKTAPAAQAVAPTPTSAPKKAHSGLSKLANPVKLPLHERLSTLRRSAFDKHRPEPADADTSDTANARTAGSDSTAVGRRMKIDQEPAVTPRQVGSRDVAPQNIAPRDTKVSPRYATSVSPEMEESTPAAEEPPVVEPQVVEPNVIEPGSLRTHRPGEHAVSAPGTGLSGSSLSDGDERVLFARRGPALSVQTIGPRQIAVGKESVYQVQVQNAGQEGADEVVVSVELPPWAEVVGTQPSSGTAESAPARAGGKPLLWRIDHLEAGSQERLLLRIVPRQSKPFDLAVRWDYRATASQTMIEVQEPRLEAKLDGPRDVLYGKSELYKVTLANTGNGPAENVIITLLPVGSGNQPVSQNLGAIMAGEEKVLEVELTARQVGDLEVRVQVRGDGGLHAELAERVMVRRAALAAAVDGPEVQYLGTDAAFRIRVANPGTATAGSKYLGGIDGARMEANGTKVAWTLPAVAPDAQREFALRCNLGLPGPARLEVVSAADDELTAAAGATTRVEAIADLVLGVQDPGGPVPVGSETTYEVVVRNRGTKSAEDVQVKAFFSHGIEPTRAEGAGNRIGPGQVIFSPISSIPAGGELVLSVQARAETSGNHIFRAEVHCQALGTRLVTEETTHYYLDSPASAATPDSQDSPADLPGPQPLDGAGARQLPGEFPAGD